MSWFATPIISRAQGLALFEAAKQKGLEGILAKKRASHYEERRSREWLKIKVTQTVDCVIGGFTDPEGSRQYFGSIVLGLYDKKGRLDSRRASGDGLQSGDAERNLAEYSRRWRPIAIRFMAMWTRPTCTG